MEGVQDGEEWTGMGGSCLERWRRQVGTVARGRVLYSTGRHPRLPKSKLPYVCTHTYT